MADAKPDAIVKEETIREAVDALSEGLATNARMVGALPDSRAIAEYAQSVVAEQVKRHEEQFAGGVPDAPRRLTHEERREIYKDSLGEVTHFSRPLGEASADWHGTGEVVAVSPRLQAVLKRHEKAPPTKEDLLLKKRVDYLLRAHPDDWGRRIQAAYRDGANAEFMSQLNMGKAIDYKEVESKACDAVIDVANASNAVFGDWKNPKPPPGIIIVSG